MKKHPETWTVGKIWANQGVIDFSPPYQRRGGVWTADKQQTLVDSVLNGYDIPKIYLHGIGSDNKHHFSVIDGKQRMQCLLEFMENKFPLAPSFEIDSALYSHIKSAPPKAGDFFKQFSDDWKEAFKAVNLDFVIIDENLGIEDLIEDLYGRLNNGVALNVTEKRHAIPGVMSKYVSEVAESKFFTEYLRIDNKRYKHEEIAIKIIKMAIMAEHGAKPICDFRPSSLDRIVRDGRNYTDVQLDPIRKKVDTFLGYGTRYFKKQDPLLDTYSLVPGYFAFVYGIQQHYGHDQLNKMLSEFFDWFENERIDNNQEADEDKQDSDLLTYTEMAGQGTTSLNSMETRVEILSKFFLRKNSDVQIKDKIREFNSQERYAIWSRAGRRCQNASCARDLPSMDLMSADHVLAWANGGATALANAQCLCVPCNSAKGARPV